MDVNYPMGSELSPLESERFRHKAFAKSVTRFDSPIFSDDQSLPTKRKLLYVLRQILF